MWKVCIVVFLAACTATTVPASGPPVDSSPGSLPDSPPPDSAPLPPIGGDRPVTVHVPPSYVPGTPMPLVMMLHGYTATGPQTESGFKIATLADSRGFLYVTPTGPIDKLKNPFWFATDACCDFYDTKPKVDDSAYLSQVIKEISARYTVDPKRVFIIGLSAGGFMAYRMACDHGDQIAAIASFAGAMWSDPTKCPAKTPVNVLHVHGSIDTNVPFDGGLFNAPHTVPSVAQTVADWIAFNHCSSTGTSGPPRDLNKGLAGNETTVTTYAKCASGGSVELWTIVGQGHNDNRSATYNDQLIDFLLAHPKL